MNAVHCWIRLLWCLVLFNTSLIIFSAGWAQAQWKTIHILALSVSFTSIKFLRKNSIVVHAFDSYLFCFCFVVSIIQMKENECLKLHSPKSISRFIARWTECLAHPIAVLMLHACLVCWFYAIPRCSIISSCIKVIHTACQNALKR